MDYANYGSEFANEMADVAAGFAAGAIIFIIVISLIGLAIGIFEIIALSKLFKKAGKPGWAAIVPVYNMIILYEIIGYKWYYIFVFILSAIPIIGGLVVLLFGLTMNMKLAKSFGQSTGYGIGLWLLGAIFIPIIAFSNDIKYVGPAVNGDIDFNDLF